MFRTNLHGLGWLVTAGLSLALAAGLVWYVRQVWRRRLRPPGYFLTALVIHVLLVVGSFYVYLDPGAAPAIQRRFDRIVVSTRTSLDGLRRLFQQADDGFEQVADLKSVATEGRSATCSKPASAAWNMRRRLSSEVRVLTTRRVNPRLICGAAPGSK